MAVATSIVVLLAFILGYRQDAPTGEPPVFRPIDDRRTELRAGIVLQEAAFARAVDTYSPKSKAAWDNPATFADTLNAIPGVAGVDASVVENATGRIIHLRDLHFVPRDQVAFDMIQAYARTFTTEESNLLCEQHLLEVELVQIFLHR